MHALQVTAAELARGRPYAEREEHEPAWHDKLALRLWHDGLAPLVRRAGGTLHTARGFAARVQALDEPLRAVPDTALKERFRALAPALRRDGFAPAPTAEVFALVREAGARVLGKRHYESQLIAGWWLLGGHLAEMATGEGKTFAATLPACTAALAGLPVHVITVNDYLAARDAESMDALYAFFGLRCSAVVHGLTRHERRAAYGADICYASNKELAFDYLRDRAALGDHASPLHLAVQGLRQPGAAENDAIVLRGLVLAIVDEADSVFIDEARTPLILSRSVEVADLHARCDRALTVARALHQGEHFQIEWLHRRLRLSDAGRAELERLGAAAGPPPDDGAADAEDSAAQFEEDVQRALSALWLHRRDEHYVVMDDKVQIVDAGTGRVMPDRAWEQGLHQMIEAKEGVPLTGRRETLARITYQRLFRRYLRLAGMTGTGTEVAAEIGRVYGLPVARVPLHLPSQRRWLGTRCLPDAAAKWQAVADAVQRCARDEGRPVLIGTRTVKASEEISAVLQQRGVEHWVLNAKQDQDEAALIARAGAPARVTVATNMAGRGTDILLGPGVAERGGLHVILTEYNDSRRVDRQLIGRAARQGDPGSAEALVALDDGLFVSHAPRLVQALRARGGEPGALALALLRWQAQRAVERVHCDARENTLQQDRRLSRTLAFSGRGE